MMSFFDNDDEDDGVLSLDQIKKQLVAQGKLGTLEQAEIFDSVSHLTYLMAN